MIPDYTHTRALYICIHKMQILLILGILYIIHCITLVKRHSNDLAQYLVKINSNIIGQYQRKLTN